MSDGREQKIPRRKLLGLLGAGSVGLAGCSGIGGSDNGGNGDDTPENGSDSTPTNTPDGNDSENGEEQVFDISTAITQPGENQEIVFDRSDNLQQVLKFELETEAPTANYGIYITDDRDNGEVLHTVEEETGVQVGDRAFTRELTWEEMNQNLEPGNHVLAVEGAVENQNSTKADQAYRPLTLKEYLEASFNRDESEEGEALNFGDKGGQLESAEIDFSLDSNASKLDYELTVESEVSQGSVSLEVEQGVEPGDISVTVNYEDLLNSVGPGEYTLKLTAQTDSGETTKQDTIPITVDEQGFDLQQNIQNRSRAWQTIPKYERGPTGYAGLKVTDWDILEKANDREKLQDYLDILTEYDINVGEISSEAYFVPNSEYSYEARIIFSLDEGSDFDESRLEGLDEWEEYKGVQIYSQTDASGSEWGVFYDPDSHAVVNGWTQGNIGPLKDQIDFLRGDGRDRLADDLSWVGSEEYNGNVIAHSSVNNTVKEGEFDRVDIGEVGKSGDSIVTYGYDGEDGEWVEQERNEWNDWKVGQDFYTRGELPQLYTGFDE